MDQELLVRQIMQEVMKNMQGSAAACECESKVTVEDYPLGEKKPELIKSASGKSLNDLTLQGVIDGKLDAKDFRITKELWNYRLRLLNLQDVDSSQRT